MASEACYETGEWIEEEISRPMEEWVEREEQRCQERSCNWWCLCCNKWFCWIAVFFVKVVNWIVETVVKWVVHTICVIISTIVELFINIFQGLFDILVGIFTGDWDRAFDGLVQLFGGIIEAVLTLTRIALLGDTIDFIRREANKNTLRNYVRRLLEQRYSGDELDDIKEALGVDHGEFGFRIAARALRTYVRSDSWDPDASAPNLILWHEDPSFDLNLRALAGYEYEDFWRRARPEIVSDSGHFSREDLNRYIESRGFRGSPFTIYCMNRGTLQTKLNVASAKGRQLGLIFRWQIEDVEVNQSNYVRHSGSGEDLINFLSDENIAQRHRESEDSGGAVQDLCTVVAAGIFRYVDLLNGLSIRLRETICLNGERRDGSDSSGVTFRDRIPDIVWKYVPIHEIGHYFGLCHVDGLDRIMYSPEHNTWASRMLLIEYLYLSGGPGFTLDEARRAWDYIVANFPAACLSNRAE